MKKNMSEKNKISSASITIKVDVDVRDTIDKLRATADAIEEIWKTKEENDGQD